ncbi:MAG: molybdenum cofactor biosynthesis enzyme [Gordonibacter sp.]|uniref:molybdenum cofactor biosynthesis enzyme n=1 Tax=Gordonibacter sp. TaxID=1968902 RepID=UPI002FCB0393
MDRGVVVVRLLRLRYCRHHPRSLFKDEEGFTTAGVALALLITLSLIFTSGQVYRVGSASADVQNVADATALAAQNEVAEFMIVVRACDAVVLSLSLTGIVATGLGVAALCTPATAAASETLLKAGREVMRARDAFADKAAAGLNHLQKALPFLAAASAASIASANGGGPMGAAYLGLAVLVPADGDEIAVDAVEGVHDLADDIDQEANDIKQAAADAERAAQEVNEWKERAFRRDCGDDPSYCMFERAHALAGLGGSDNPRYASVDAWSFSVALDRARTYYAHRLAEEAPQGSSVEEQARSALRERFYAFASSEVARGYVRETAGSFDALFPHLPKNTEQMRATALYTEGVYPISISGDGSVMHAWEGCPEASGAAGRGSIAQMEQGGFPRCAQCGFSAASMGKVAAASTSIENGFEYHYEAVAQAADAYQKARAELDPLTSEVKGKAGGLFDRCLDMLRKVGGKRIDAAPPGRFGVVAFVVNTKAAAASTGFASGYVREAGSLGARAAVSAATLVAEPSDEGKNVLSSLLDGLEGSGGAMSGALGIVLDCWSGLLRAYLDGQQAVEGSIERALGALPLASASGLGTWAASALEKAVGALGLQPAKLDALKPVVVNSAHVAGADGGSFSTRFLAVKARAIATPLSSTDLFSSVVTSAEAAALDSIAGLGGTIEIASIRLFGDEGPSIPITIVLPQAAQDAAAGLISDIADGVRALYAQVTGVRTWE